VPVDRSGTTGKLAEVYPAAALRAWGLTSSGYKGKPNASVCEVLASELAQRCGALTSVVAECLRGCDDDGLDAVVAAIVAKAVLTGDTSRPVGVDLAAARREGWIHIPTVSLEEIIEA
jgi:hypothetical protein